MTAIITLPGIHGSGPAHWQSRWELLHPTWKRFQPPDWDRPDLETWLDALDRALAAGPALLVAHSLSCLLVAHRAARTDTGVLGAFLVATPDPEGPAFPAAAAGFRPVPDRRLPFPALMVVSANDPYGSPAHALRRAAAWGAELVMAGDLGHVNAASGLGDWPQGMALLATFRSALGRHVIGDLRGRRMTRTPQEHEIFPMASTAPGPCHPPEGNRKICPG